jgi:predicted regulator of Ras-like GTPase activity (Roadblock/LC7/MglB family)
VREDRIGAAAAAAAALAERAARRLDGRIGVA